MKPQKAISTFDLPEDCTTLSVTRSDGDGVIIDGRIRVSVRSICGRTHMTIQAPPNVPLERDEVALRRLKAA